MSSGHRMSRFSTAAVLLAVGGLLVACRGGEEQADAPLGVDVAISPTPPAVGPARLLITLTDSSGAPLDGARVSVEGNMSHAGMAPVRDSARTEGDPGRYVVPQFTFTMAGDWIVTVEALLPDGRRVLRDVATDVVGPMGERR